MQSSVCGSCIWLPRAEYFLFLKVRGHPNPGSTGLKVSPCWGMAVWLRKRSAIEYCKTLGFQGSSLEPSLSHVSIQCLSSPIVSFLAHLSDFQVSPHALKQCSLSICLPPFLPTFGSSNPSRSISSAIGDVGGCGTRLCPSPWWGESAL